MCCASWRRDPGRHGLAWFSGFREPAPFHPWSSRKPAQHHTPSHPGSPRSGLSGIQARAQPTVERTNVVSGFPLARPGKPGRLAGMTKKWALARNDGGGIIPDGTNCRSGIQERDERFTLRLPRAGSTRRCQASRTAGETSEGCPSPQGEFPSAPTVRDAQGTRRASRRRSRPGQPQHLRASSFLLLNSVF